ncbi:protein asteroid [Schistocerca cancellata]|uniref:protein asteroid n=1 Tax=Schistocerca cancellata TaxID=274614 RepID=UPI0021178469|nr:protein asteroid [Schistocerca cancellata]
MGIRGLTTYIQSNADKYLESYELHNSHLVIDGNNIASHLYSWFSKCNSAFGGDYDEYEKSVKDFFKLLRVCNIFPLVVLDGGYEPRKLNTAKSRLRSRYHIAKNVTPRTQSSIKFFPLMMKEVFKDALLHLDIPFVQCDFEADDEIAALARNLGCPVLSYDSDFYVYDVPYIPFSTLQMEPIKCSMNENKYFINCKLYRIENFLNSFGGLEKEMLPLLATLLGNDYIKRSTFSNFFSQLKLPKNKTMSETQKRICGLLQWLRKETPETARNKVLGHLKKPSRESVERQIMKIASGYHPTEIHSALGLPLQPALVFVEKRVVQEEQLQETHSLHSDYTPGEEMGCNTIDNICSDSGSENTYSDNDCEEPSSNSDEEKCTNSESEGGSKSETDEKSACVKTAEENIVLSLPEWFKNSFRKGNMPTSFHDMLTQKLYFMSPQVEDYSLVFSQDISIPIIQIIFGLLMSGKPSTLSYYSRSPRGQLQKYCLSSLCKTSRVKEFPSLLNLPQLPLTERQYILLDTMGIKDKTENIIQKLCPEWRLFAIALKYWFSHTTQPVLNSCHIHALIFSAVVLNIVSKVPGYYKPKKSLSSVLKKVKLSEVEKSSSESDDFLFGEFLQSSDALSEPNKMLHVIRKEDSILLANIILPFHQINEHMKSNARLYSVTTVHAFAQFQSCLMHLRHLNALLSFPFPQILPAKFYSGTLVYNMFMNFQKRSDVMGYVCHLLQKAESVLVLYKSVIEALFEMLPLLPSLKRRRHKKKKKGAHMKVVDDTDDDNGGSSGSQIAESAFSDLNNRFSILGTGDR